MARIRSVDFLPEIFRTETNQQFLGATLDQMIQEPKLKRTQGFIGRRAAPGASPTDRYITEPTTERSQYQLEPTVVFKTEGNGIKDALTYPGMVDALSLAGDITDRQDRLWKSDFYTWDPFVDFDKFINYNQYYWLPAGPDPVDVSNTVIPTTDSYNVTRGNTAYTFTDVVGNNPILTLVRGGSYTFNLDQSGNGFFIQTNPGIDGKIPTTPNISSRDVLGVVNNGEDLGTVTFNVPLKDAQAFYYGLNDLGTVDLVTNLKFNQINNQYVDVFNAQYGGIDGLTDLEGRTIIFLNNEPDAEAGGWQVTTQFDPLPNAGNVISGTGSFDTVSFDQTTDITNQAQRYSVWQIEYVADSDGQFFIRLNSVLPVPNLSKVQIDYGSEYSSVQFYKNASGYWQRIPLLTAVKDELYYQDSNNPELFGLIRLIDQDSANPILISDIVGKASYVSPNGVTFTNGLKVQFRGAVEPASYQDQQYYVEGVGSSIQLLPVTDFVTPETYTQSATVPYDSTGFDVGNFDGSLNQPLIADYLTINRASQDKNPWTRSNRWFHADVISATADYNSTVAVFDQNYRAKRPILEYRAGLRLWDFGTQGKTPVNIIDTVQTDAFSNVNGQLGYAVDGYSLVEGSRVIFAADLDDNVRNKIYTVEFINPDSISPLITQPIINLVPTTDSAVSEDQTVVVLSGITLQGKSFRYTGSTWEQTQQKTDVNQAPLFDVYDINGISLGNTTTYPSTTFAGSKLFSYAVGTGTDDPVLGFPLRYLNINNVGDIVFDNNLYTDSFLYVVDSSSTTADISIGHAREYSDRTVFAKRIGWQKAVEPVISRQIFDFTYQGQTLKLDIQPTNSLEIPLIKIYDDSVFVLPKDYTVTLNADGTTSIVFINQPAANSIIQVEVISDQVSQIAYYDVPKNLQNNPLNRNSTSFTLGAARTHYSTICENLSALSGSINGNNNTRDLGNIIPYGESIVQQSSPAVIAATWLRDAELDIFQSIEYNRREYEKFKSLILDTAIGMNVDGLSISKILDDAIAYVNAGKTPDSSFYWSDALPSGGSYTETATTFTAITSNVFDLSRTYDLSTANYYAVLVYVNDVQLLGFGHDFTVATDGPRLTIHSTLNVGDVVKIREYSSTAGSYCPATPSKLGLYPVYEPEIYLDTTYVTPTNVIKGHDGSLTVAFGDFRDDLLLEFEKRIYNNIKVSIPNGRYEPPISIVDVVPGQFRSTDWSLSEVNQILSKDFLSWVGYNKLDYKTQDYISSNEFTWNYSTASSRLDSSLLLGNWRGVYKFYYDTDTPNTRPWEMLGITEQPSWWNDRYGPAPYTSDNLVLWEDLEAGIVADPAGSYVKPAYVRPGLTNVIPSDSEGNLVSPFISIVQNYDQVSFRKSWVVGDQGPVETAWRRSSSYPFAVMRLFALTKPAQFFSLFIDRDRYRLDADYNQWLYDRRYRIDLNDVEIYGNGTAKHSFINWTVDWNRDYGVDTITKITETLANLDVQLAYRMASYTDKKYLKVLTEKSSPQSQNTSLLVPDESYSLLLYRNQPFRKISFSSVIVQKQADGYAVFGYSITDPYFTISTSVPNGNYTSFTVNGTTYRLSKDFSDQPTLVPYGYVFSSKNGVVDFLNSYGHYLQKQGLVFESSEDGIIIDWNRMSQEFINWSDQSWVVGSLVNLNPGAREIRAVTTQSVADPINLTRTGTQILDQNKQPVPNNDIVIDRIGSEIKIRCIGNQTLNFVNVNFTAYEHLLILDNSTIFNDLIYDPITGVRQDRLNINGFTTYEWNGLVDAQGFIYNQDNLSDWVPNRKYSKGQLVKYKDSVWSASDIIQPQSTFDFDMWIKSDYDQIQKGLLPNIATKSEQLKDMYDKNTVNLETDSDLLAYGLIGYRPRQYMKDIDLDDVSQVGVYQQFIGTKGTRQATDLFQGAVLDKEVSQYEIFENWAVKRALYGASANRNYIEIKLDESLLQANPATVEILNTGQTSEADQSLLVSSLYKQSKKYTDNSIFPTTLDEITDVQLPSAGYVNTNDVDFSVFELDTVAADALADVAVGSTVWVAKDNAYDWNIYRTTLVPSEAITLTDNLNGTSLLIFNGIHNLTVGQTIVIRYFDSTVNGTYVVRSVPNIYSITIDFVFAGQQTSVSGNGTVMVLQTVRVSQASDIVNLSFANNLRAGSKAWVDDDGTGHWAVYQKVQPFSSLTSLTPREPIANANFGASLAQGYNNRIAAAGDPNYNSGQGAVYTYVRTGEDVYAQNNILELNSTDVLSFGNAVTIGYETWMAVGAKDSNKQGGQSVGRGYVAVINKTDDTNEFQIWQLLVPEIGEGLADEFGYSVEMSRDERWLYVGAPGRNRIYAYGRVDVQTQQKDFVGDGEQLEFFIGDSIVVDTADQLVVTVDNVTVSTYTLVDNNVRFTSGPPVDGAVINIARRSSMTFTGDASTTTFDISDIYTATDIYSFRVLVDGVLQRPKYDYDFGDPSTLSIEFVTAPSNGAEIIVRSLTHFKLVDAIEGVTLLSPLATERFGHSVATTTDGRQVLVGCPVENASGPTLRAGKTYAYDRSVERFIAESTNVTSKTIGPVLRTITDPVAVYKNGVLLTNTAGNIGGDYTISGSNILLETAPQVGDVFEIETNQFELIQSWQANLPNQDAKYGWALDQCTNNCSVYIGAPYDSSTNPEAGSVERWVNQARLYGVITGSVANPTLTAGNSLRINNTDVIATGTTVDSFVTDINDAGIPNVIASKNSSGKLVLSVKNADAVVGEFNKLSVLPGITNSGTSLMTSLGLTPYSYTQTLRGPVDQSYSHFGSTVVIDDGADNLVVSAPDGTVLNPTTFDSYTTYFDAGSTTLTDPVPQSGVVYTYDYLDSANGSITNPGKFVFGQQLLASDLGELDRFGTAISYITGKLMVTAPAWDGTSTDDSGKIYIYTNANLSPAWSVIRRQVARTDTKLINSIYLYDKRDQQVLSYLDFIDPMQGKILGAARQNIDYISAIDPASYNVGNVNNNGTSWREGHDGKIWWNVTNARFLNYNQNDIVYDSRQWGQLFPGSSVDIYQWVESTTPPDVYEGPGVPYSLTSYTTVVGLNADNTFETRYYFWVSGLTAAAKNKSLSTISIQQYIENPKSSGIAYAAVMDSHTVALFNSLEYISATDTILNVEFDQQYTDNNVHIEYELVAQNDPNSFLSAGLYRKLQDSLCGVDTLGNIVPDSTLSPADLYGVEFRPRQSMFKDRFTALENYLTRVNSILAQYPIREDRRYPLLLSQDPEPGVSSNTWDLRVADLQELGYQDLNLVPTGYRYLVANDSSNRGLWTIYVKQSDNQLLLTRVQNYDTNLYWNYIDWYQPGFSSLSKPIQEVSTYNNLATLTPSEGMIVKVTSNSAGLWELYEYTQGTWTRRALQSGTIEISENIWNYSVGRYGFDVEVFDAQYFDQEPVIETRKIIQSINQELLIDDLAVNRNDCLMLLFEYIMTEQTAPEWLVKTSLVDVEHKIRDLLEYPVYNQDNQNFVEDYLNEVKPYHVKVKEFRLRYDGTDQFPGDITDFDVPAYYDSTLKKFISPILDETNPPLDDFASFAGDQSIWTTRPWSYWYNNYLLEIKSVSIYDGGEGYTVAPTVTVTGNCVRQATMTALVNSAGQVYEIVINDPGYGYTDTATITLSGGNGTGAKAVAIMGNSLVRSLKTVIKYNRCEYSQTVVDWATDTTYDDGTLVRYNNKVYSALSPDSTAVYSGESFDPDFYVEVDPSTLSAADRTMGLYIPEVNRTGLDLGLLIGGISYPGVQVTGPLFSQNTGFDVGAFDVNPFDNIDYGPEGLPTYDPAILDAIYQSDFTDIYLGTRATDINVEGGGFVDTYSSHAPEELVPGSMFDTLDIKVFTRPGADWTEHGFGWPAKQISYLLDSTGQTLSWSGVLDYPAALVVINATSETALVQDQDYTVNWAANTITILTAGSGEIIKIVLYSMGGGNQLYRTALPSANLVNSSITVPVASDEIQYVAAVVNGQTYTSTSVQSINDYSSKITFNTSIPASSWIAVSILGYETGTSRSWSTVISESAEYDGSTRTFAVTDALVGSNAANMIVEVNGKRLRPPEGTFYVGNGIQSIFDTSTSGDIDSALIANNEISVYVNDSLLTQGSEYTVLPYDSSSYLSVSLNTVPAVGDRVVVYVRTASPYYISGNNVVIKPTYSLTNGDIISWRSFKDTTQQRLRTKVFKGPNSGTTTTTIAYDTDGYDASGFDYSVTVGVDTLTFDLQTTDIRPELAWVTFNGNLLTYGEQFIIETFNGSVFLTLTDITVTTNDIIAITFMTANTVNPAITYRVVKDMKEVRGIYRINTAGTTYLTQNVDSFSTRIYVNDVSTLPLPDLAAGQFGKISIGGEWILYRDVDTATNSVGGLRRGVSGTAMDNHSINDPVYNFSNAELLPAEYQDTVAFNNFTGDDATTTFATDISIGSGDSSDYGSAVMVFLGGSLLDSTQYTVDLEDPVTVTLSTAAPAGQIVTVLVRRGYSLYGNDGGTALQDLTNSAALFLKS